MAFCVVVSAPEHILSHSMYGDWALPGYDYAYLPVGCLLRMLPPRAPESVAFDRICAKPGDFTGGDDFSGKRYEEADTRYPGILVRDMPNPCDRPYRMIDGRRRMHKLLSSGADRGEYLVYRFSEIQPFVIEVRIDPGAEATPSGGADGGHKRRMHLQFTDAAAKK